MPLSKKSSTNLTTKEVFRIFQKAQTAELSKAAPVLPCGSEMFLFSLGNNPDLWEIERKKFR